MSEANYVQLCEWFAGCPREAEFLTPHPVLGEVPACQRCNEFATGDEPHPEE